jgi:hypothetical protein
MTAIVDEFRALHAPGETLARGWRYAGAAFKVMQRLLADGQYDAMFEHAVACPNFNKLFAG